MWGSKIILGSCTFVYACVCVSHATIDKYAISTVWIIYVTCMDCIGLGNSTSFPVPPDALGLAVDVVLVLIWSTNMQWCHNIYCMDHISDVRRLHWHRKFHLVLSSSWRTGVCCRISCLCRNANVISSSWFRSRIIVNLALPQIVYSSCSVGSKTFTDGSQLWLPNQISCSPTAILSLIAPVLSVSFMVHALFVNLFSDRSMTHLRRDTVNRVVFDLCRRTNANFSYSSSLLTPVRIMFSQLGDGKHGTHSHDVSSIIVSPRFRMHPFFTTSPRSSALWFAGLSLTTSEIL